MYESVLPLFNETTQKPVDNPVTIVMQKGVIVGMANHTVLQASRWNDDPDRRQRRADSR